MRLILLPLLAFGASGCVARAALDVATLPVKAASAGIDAVTTTQAEADRRRGREIRLQEECLGKAERRARKAGREPDYESCEPKRR